MSLFFLTRFGPLLCSRVVFDRLLAVRPLGEGPGLHPTLRSLRILRLITNLVIYLTVPTRYL